MIVNQFSESKIQASSFLALSDISFLNASGNKYFSEIWEKKKKKKKKKKKTHKKNLTLSISML